MSALRRRGPCAAALRNVAALLAQARAIEKEAQARYIDLTDR